MGLLSCTRVSKKIARELVIHGFEALGANPSDSKQSGQAEADRTNQAGSR